MTTGFASRRSNTQYAAIFEAPRPGVEALLLAASGFA
jgi:hypothetical protein